MCSELSVMVFYCSIAPCRSNAPASSTCFGMFSWSSVLAFNASCAKSDCIMSSSALRLVTRKYGPAVISVHPEIFSISWTSSYLFVFRSNVYKPATPVSIYLLSNSCNACSFSAAHSNGYFANWNLNVSKTEPEPFLLNSNCDSAWSMIEQGANGAILRGTRAITTYSSCDKLNSNKNSEVAIIIYPPNYKCAQSFRRSLARGLSSW